MSSGLLWTPADHLFNIDSRLAEVLRQVVDMKNEGRVTALLSSKHDQETILDCINDMNAIFRDFNFQIQLRVFDSMAKVEETVIVCDLVSVDRFT